MNHLFVSFTLIKPDRMVTLTSICFWMSQCCFLIKMFMIMKHTIWTMLPVVVSVEQYLIVLQHGPCYLVQSMSGYVLRSICRKTNSNQFTWISFPLILDRLFQWLPLLKLSRRQDRSKRFLLWMKGYCHPCPGELLLRILGMIWRLVFYSSWQAVNFLPFPIRNLCFLTSCRSRCTDHIQLRKAILW
jgi:hypothetical protein